MKRIAGDRPPTVLVEVIVSPIEVRVPPVLEGVEVGHVRVAVRIPPPGTNVSGIICATIR